MIYTLTLNPSIDYFVTMDQFEMGKTNRTTSERMLPGGKGINVSIVLSHLGMESTALGFTAGFTGDQIEKELEKEQIITEMIHVKEGFSRINVKLLDHDGTEINGQGPKVDTEALKALYDRIQSLREGDYLVLAGSIPSGLPKTIYEKLMESMSGKGVRVIVDASGDLLLNALKYHPFLIKPNHHELSAIFDEDISQPEQVFPYAEKLQTMGAENVVVSLSSKGAVLLSENGDRVHLPAVGGSPVNAVGAGDSMVAGFIYGYETTKDAVEAFRFACAAGSASACHEDLADREQILDVYRELEKL